MTNHLYLALAFFALGLYLGYTIGHGRAWQKAQKLLAFIQQMHRDMEKNLVDQQVEIVRQHHAVVSGLRKREQKAGVN